jgi:tRNA pseudouridine(55) synthase
LTVVWIKLKELTPYCEKSDSGSIRGMTVPLYKPTDWTSFDVVNKCRRISGFRKVGHAGTLDPFAEGLLILGFGTHTKKLDKYREGDKIYRVSIRLGAESDTQDPTGKIRELSRENAVPSLQDVETVLDTFVGELLQVPPMYSAKKVQGKRLYTLARKGRIIEREAVRVRIKSIGILNYKWPLLDCRVRCGSGTYIRTLAADIGKALGSAAYAQSLLREAVGNMHIEESLTIEEFTESWKSITQSQM